VILRAAEAEGLDMDEFEMELEGVIYEAQQGRQAASSRPVQIAQQPAANTGSGKMSSQLEALVEIAVSGGELSEKSRNVLIRRAVAEGLDLDEFGMILDARLFRARKGNS